MKLKHFFSHNYFIDFNAKLPFSTLRMLKYFLDDKETYKDIGYNNIKHIRRILEYDYTNVIDIKTRLDLINSFGRNGTSKDSLIARFGETEGLRRFKEIFNNVKQGSSKEGYIKKFGLDEGLKKYKEARASVSLEIMQKRYGEKLGKKKWDDYLKAWKNGNSLNGYIRKYGKIDGELKWKNRQEKDWHSLDYFVHKYGEQKGKEIFYSRMNKMWYKSSEEYFIKGYGNDRGKKLFKKLKDNISLESKIDKYGETVGTEMHINFISNLKQRAIDLNYVSHFKNVNWFSKISQKLFWIIIELTNLDLSDVYFGELNGEWFIYDKAKKNISKYDFKYKNKIIEFNGDYWHRNPKFYSIDETIKERDTYKNELAKRNNFEVLVIWEDEFINKEEETINKCINFLIN